MKATCQLFYWCDSDFHELPSDTTVCFDPIIRITFPGDAIAIKSTVGSLSLDFPITVIQHDVRQYGCLLIDVVELAVFSFL